MATSEPQSKPTPQPAPFTEQWGPIVPGNLGLKAGYYPATEGGAVQFITVVGWFTCTTRTIDPPLQVKNFFFPVVVAPNGGLTPAMMVTGNRYLGTFPADMDPTEAWKLSEQWRGHPAVAQQHQQQELSTFPMPFDPKNPPNA